MTVFFDSWGGLWSVCRGDDEWAVAFGPSGFARRTTADYHGLEYLEGETAWAAAQRQGRIVHRDGWDYLRRV